MNIKEAVTILEAVDVNDPRHFCGLAHEKKAYLSSAIEVEKLLNVPEGEDGQEWAESHFNIVATENVGTDQYFVPTCADRGRFSGVGCPHDEKVRLALKTVLESSESLEAPKYVHQLKLAGEGVDLLDDDMRDLNTAGATKEAKVLVAQEHTDHTKVVLGLVTPALELYYRHQVSKLLVG